MKEQWHRIGEEKRNVKYGEIKNRREREENFRDYSL